MNIEAEAARIVATAKAEAEHFARFGRPVQPVPANVPAAQPVPAIPTIQENPMSFGTALHRIAAVAEKIGDDADDVLVAITDHPEGVAVLRAVAAAMGIPLPVGAIGQAATAFKIAVSAYEAGKATAAQNGQPQQVQQPAAMARPAVV